MIAAQRDRMLGTESIGKLLVRLSVPASVAMIVMALYNLVDSDRDSILASSPCRSPMR